jgi:hypothetical protein
VADVGEEQRLGTVDFGDCLSAFAFRLIGARALATEVPMCPATKFKKLK